MRKLILAAIMEVAAFSVATPSKAFTIYRVNGRAGE